ncbi:hypothetical protein [Phenylobacterium sp.]|uniref:hypothetical protein n=1 Tax=Phenylobacterium sp. TaxID=1871053 RepID=UPI003784CEE8
MSPSADAPSAKAVRWTVIAGYLLMLAANLPGHLSVDPVLSLYEGRFHERITWGPPFHAWLLGVFDELLAGTSLYVMASGLMLFGGWLWLVRMTGRPSWLAVPVAAAIVLTPNILIYQGIVWKDVFFANSATLGFILLIAAARGFEAGRKPVLALAGAALMFAMAALVRQNGLIAWLPAAAAVAWAARAPKSGDRRWITPLAWAGGWLAVVYVVAKMLSAIAVPAAAGEDVSVSRGVRIVQHYDIAGALALDPTLPLRHIDRVDPAADDILRARAGRVWSPERVDHFAADEAVGQTFWKLPDAAVRAEWLQLITEHPGIYLKTRLADFRWVLATPDIDRCLPVHVGIDGPPQHMARLGMVAQRDGADDQLYNYVTWFLDTPVMSHVAYLVLAVLVAGALALRRRAADMPMIGLQLAAVGFAASFLVISIACDYRYLYFLDVAALTGLFYLSLDPAVWRRRGRR